MSVFGTQTRSPACTPTSDLSPTHTPSPSCESPAEWHCPLEPSISSEQQEQKTLSIFAQFLRNQGNPGAPQPPQTTKNPLTQIGYRIRQALQNAYTLNATLPADCRSALFLKSWFDEINKQLLLLQNTLTLFPQAYPKQEYALQALHHSRRCLKVIQGISQTMPHSGPHPYAAWISPELHWLVLSRLTERMQHAQQQLTQSACFPELKQITLVLLRLNLFIAAQSVRDYPLLHARCSSDPAIDPDQA